MEAKQRKCCSEKRWITRAKYYGCWEGSKIRMENWPVDLTTRGHCNLHRYVCSRSSVQSLSLVWLFATPWTTVRQASLSITNCRSLPKPMSIEPVMPSNHLIFCLPLLLLPSIFPSIRVFSNESSLHIRWPKYCSFSFNISPSNEHPGLISFRMNWLDPLAVQGTLKSLSNTTIQKHQFFSAQLSLQSNSHIHTRLLEKP